MLARYPGVHTMPTFALCLAYDGAAFAGWWRQKHRRTVGGVLDEAFTRIGEAQAHAIGASRTDAGVHARGQVAHVRTARPWTAHDLHHALARHLPADCSCVDVGEVADTWHACHAAIGKTYSYRIANAPIHDPFSARFAWRIPYQVDLVQLRDSARVIPGRRDWCGFARRGETRPHLVRTITDVSWKTQDELLICTIAGDGFTYRLVRSLVGAMVAVAGGGCDAGQLQQALHGQSSPAGAQQAPAHGLCLERVDYALRPRWLSERVSSQA
jgi:tRNA pseudouridine38-40 synthase